MFRVDSVNLAGRRRNSMHPHLALMHEADTPAAARRKVEPVLGGMVGMILDVHPASKALG
ncbi:hypothetical protein D3C72_2279190 [compost metagenome]